MIAEPQASRTYSPSEYLDFEVQADTRHEYLDGDIVPMTGGTPNHNQIALNLAGTLNFMLRQQPYRVFMADQRLWIPGRQMYTYPDVMVIAGELAYQSGRRDTLTNPVLIIEVLSKSTADYDRSDKFAAYRTIPTFTEYLLVDQFGYAVEQYTKQGAQSTGAKQWLLQIYDEPGLTVNLATVGVELPLVDVYRNVQFETAGATESPSALDSEAEA